MTKPYVPRPAGRHIKDPKTGALTRSGPFTDPNAAAKPAPAPAKTPPTPPMPAAEPDKADPADKKGN